jgi:chromosomal replication initiation ATPase DnaA
MSIHTPEKQTKLTNQLMENIRDLLNGYFIEMGITMVPTIGVAAVVDKNHMGIKEIVEVVNTTVDKDVYPSGLSTRSRKRDLVMKRQIVSYVCRSFGFQFHHIARSMFINHATVIHGANTVKNLLENKDEEMMTAYEDIVRVLTVYHKEKYGKDLPPIS